MKLSDRVFWAEQRLVAVALGVMGIVVFFDVIHRVASREMSIQARFGWAIAAVVVSTWALQIRGRAAGLPRVGAVKRWLAGAALALILYLGLRAFLAVLPNGLVWSQTLGLVLTLWVGIFGASMAARQRRHLALDLGSKLWPRKALPYVQCGGNILTGVFCLVLAGLAGVSLRDHFRDYADTAGAGGVFPALAIPKWAAFAGLPLGFALMAVRFFAQGLESLRGKLDDDDALRMLGLSVDSQAASEPKR